MIRGNDAEVVLVCTTLPADSDIEAFGRVLVSESLAACVVAGGEGPSVYAWQGKVEVARERQIAIKTTATRVAELERRIAELHPYDVPEFLVLSVQGGSESYLDWIRASVAPNRDHSERDTN